MKRADQPMPISDRFLRLLAAATALIGTAGLIALMAQDGWAAPPADSNNAPPRAFNNPFAAPPQGGAGDNFFSEDEEAFEADEEFADEEIPPPTRAGGDTRGSRAAAPQQGLNQAQAPRGGGTGSQGVSVGGTTPGGVISTTESDPLPVDALTGVGSKEIVTDFNFPDADILDIAKALGKLTGKNFILDKDVKGRITLISNSPITVSDAWKAFLTALDMNGFALIPSGKYLRIARQRDARDKQLQTYVGQYSPDTDALITRVFPLKYLSADEVARTFRSFMPANSRIIPYDQTNTVIVTDTGSNIAKLEKLLDILDVETHEAQISVIGVKFASAAELAKLIDTLIPGTDAPAAGRPRGSRFGGARGGGSNFAARRTKEGGVINNIIADERTNTLIVHASAKGVDQVRALVKKLDQKLPATTGGGRVHVVYLQFADAEAIATTLNNLTQQATAPTRPGAPTGGTGVNPVSATLFEGAIRLSPDKATNSLVVTASPSDFATIQRVINKLDIPRDQVFAEVVIMEVSLDRQHQFSSNVISPANNGIASITSTDLLEFAVSPFAQRGAVLGFGFGATREVSIGGQTVRVKGVQGLIKALQTKSNANILATPQILALDNTEATFESAEKIPVPTATAVQGAVATSITKENVSLSITIKPQINKVANFVKLDINTKLADISSRELPAQVRDLAFATVERNTKTSIVVANEDTAVLGGLVRDNQSETVSKIPILGDIPLLGWLFKAKRSETRKTNLLVFITPRIVRQYETIRKILDKKLQERDNFIERTTGGDDPHREYRDDMIRSLPPMSEIMSNQLERVATIGAESDVAPAAAPARPVDKGATMTRPQEAEDVPVLGTPAPEAEPAPETAPDVEVFE